ncbi:MAG: GNAT family N-acetyltransferase [Acidimicrobiia bacterium]|nr:GNAT family N-acetyltransferase [Acidimicrobiia bacterium]
MDLRPAAPTDVGHLAELMFLEPSPEAVAMAGGADRARRLEEETLRYSQQSPASELTVAVDDDTVVGFVLVSAGGDTPPLRRLLGQSVRAMGVVGTIRAAWRARARRVVDLRPPPGGLHVVELQVHPGRRGQGIGGQLLAEAERSARARGVAHLSLTTASTNPARRLYERHGYEVVEERADARYERMTGVPGRVLMVKSLHA